MVGKSVAQAQPHPEPISQESALTVAAHRAQKEAAEAQGACDAARARHADLEARHASAAAELETLRAALVGLEDALARGEGGADSEEKLKKALAAVAIGEARLEGLARMRTTAHAQWQAAGQALTEATVRAREAKRQADAEAGVKALEAAGEAYREALKAACQALAGLLQAADHLEQVGIQGGAQQLFFRECAWNGNAQLDPKAALKDLLEQGWTSPPRPVNISNPPPAAPAILLAPLVPPAEGSRR